MRAWTRFFLVLGLLVAPAFTCEIQVGGGPIQKEYYLSVPFFRQACDLCCSAAAIQMLQGYCQQPLQSQLEILGLIGGSPTGGAWWPQIADGVNRLTCFSGASVSYYGAGDPLQLELAVTEQIASVVWYSPHRPVLPQAPLNHVGVLVGGSAVESGLKLWWNSVLYHDPASGPQPLPAHEWLSRNWFNQEDWALVQIVPEGVQPPVAQSLREEYRGYVELWDGEGFEPPFENL